MTASEFLRFLVSSMVAHPEDVAIEEIEDDLGTLLTLRAHQSDMRTIIGRDGRTIQAIRTVLRVYGSKADKRINLKILED
ncbi:MAG TPA: KH domain-containing protein [bacterium]|nr:KH domain-containing protein [bacterium]